MTRKLLLLSLFFVSVWSWGQLVADYTFSQSSGTYTVLASPIIIHASGWDDAIATVTIPFTFNFNGTPYNTCSVNTNGYLTFGTTVSSTTGYIPISATKGYDGALSAFGRNLISNSTTIVYGTEGSAPNRVFVIQWNNARRNDGGPLADVLNFQIRLYETSNISEVRYGTCSTTETANSSKGQVGLRGASNADFNNRKGANNTAWNALSVGTANNDNVNYKSGVIPASGLTFTWTPPSCTIPILAATTLITSTTATINWTAPSPAPSSGYEYEIRTSGAAGSGATGLITSGSTAAGVVTANITGLTANTQYYVYVRSNCGSSNYSLWTSSGTFTTLICNTTPLTVTEGFNTSGTSVFPTCWTQQTVVGSSNITFQSSSSNPTTSPYEGTRFVYWNSYSYTNGDETRLVSLPISTTGTANVDVEFQWMHDSGFSSSTLEGVQVQYSLDGTTWTNAGSFVPRYHATLTGWNKKTITLPSGAGNQSIMYVGFKFHSQFGNNCALDAVEVKPTPTCFTPTLAATTLITSTTATINWTAPSPVPSNGYAYEIRTSGAAGSGATGLITSGSTAAGVVTANITGLTGNTQYYVYVRSYCGGSDYSLWTSSGTFTTLCAVPNTPTSLTFPTVTPASIDGSFTASLPAPSGYIVVRSTSATPTTPTNGTIYTTGVNSLGGYIVTGNSTVITATTFTDTGLTGGTTYYYYVYAYNSGCTGGPSYSSVLSGSQATASCPIYSGTITIGPSGAFTTLTDAFAAFESCGYTGHVILELNTSYSGASETFPITIPSNIGASATETITIRPASGVNKTITSSVDADPIFKVLSSYVTIDGSNNGSTSRDLTITNTSTFFPQVILIGSTGTNPITNVAIKNLILINNNYDTNSAIEINDEGSVIGGYFNDITIQNNSVQKTYQGISARAVVAAGNGNGLLITGNELNQSGANAILFTAIYIQGVDGATISNNNIANLNGTISQYDNGIWIASNTVNSNITENNISNLIYSAGGSTGTCGINITSNVANSNILISQNTISNITSNGSISDYVCGIDVIFDTGGITIANNQISNIKNTNTSGYSAVGILLESALTSANVTVQNNFVYDIAGYGYNSQSQDNGYGIQVLSGSGYKLYHNSVSLATNQTSTSGYPAALMISSGVTQAAALDVRNNIFSIPATVGTDKYAILCNASNSVFSNLDYNVYYTSGSNIGFIGSNRVGILGLIQGFGQNLNSATETPNFISATNLHLTAPGSASAIESGAIVISGLTTDIDGDTRNATTPDIGADEYSGIPVYPITINSNPGTALCVGDTTQLTASSTTGYAFSWSPATYLNTTSGATVICTPTDDITYYVLAAIGTVTKIKTVDITADAAPTTLTLSNTDAQICSNAIQTLTASGGNLTGLTTTVNSGAVNASIPDNNLTTGYTQTLTVSGVPSGATLSKVEVLVNMTHTWDSDVVINLEAPNGQIINLVDERGSSSDNFTNTVITSNTGATGFGSGSAPFTGTFTADRVNQTNAGTTPAVTTQTFSDLFSTANGNWNIRLYDDSGSDYGVLLNGSITLYYDVNNAITWSSSPSSPNTLFSDSTCTTPYTPGTYATTVYVNPSVTTTYTATSDRGGCSKEDEVTYTIETAVYNGSWTPALTSNQSIEINADYTLATDMDVCACKINSGKKLTVPSATTLTVQNGIDNAGEIVVDHTGSLVQVNETDTNTGAGVYKIKKTTGTYKNYDYFYWSSPVENETVGTVLPTVNYKYKFNPANYLDVKSGHGYPQPTASIPGDGYDDNGDDWSYLSNSTIMPKGIGFIAMGKDSPTSFSVGQMGVSQAAFDVTFEGEKIHNGTFTAEVKQDAYNVSPGYNPNNNNLNLLGNPYPSAIDVFELYHDNASVLEGKFYFWTHDAQLAAISGPNAYDFDNNNFAIGAVTGTYPSYTYTQTLSGTGKSAPRYIASTQGFMASAIDGIASTSNVTYKNSMRATGNNNTFFRQASDIPQVSRLWLNMTGANSFNQIAVGFDISTSDTYGMGDAPRVASAANTDFYSIIQEVNGAFAIQFLSDFQDDKMVPLGISVLNQGTFEISLDHADGIFTEGQKIYLEDTYEDVIHNLNEGAYSFTQTAGTNINDRFILRFTNTALGNDDTALNTVKVYPNPSTGVFNISYQGSATLQYTVYDLTGKTILSGTGNQIDLSHQAIGMYFATFTDGSALRSLKLVRE
jgi:subtilisin-like proprotein convertase family protein